jgi:5-methylcytosine-specific restriction endonuclease McrBC regulatory subunit McrC
MKKEDEPKTSFITPSGTYCYLRMPEKLKNAGGSFSRMTSKVLCTHIGRNVLTYVDDIIVKSAENSLISLTGYKKKGTNKFSKVSKIAKTLS